MSMIMRALLYRSVGNAKVGVADPGRIRRRAPLRIGERRGQMLSGSRVARITSPVSNLPPDSRGVAPRAAGRPLLPTSRVFRGSMSFCQGALPRSVRRIRVSRKRVLGVLASLRHDPESRRAGAPSRRGAPRPIPRTRSGLQKGFRALTISARGISVQLARAPRARSGKLLLPRRALRRGVGVPCPHHSLRQTAPTARPPRRDEGAARSRRAREQHRRASRAHRRAHLPACEALRARERRS